MAPAPGDPLNKQLQPTFSLPAHFRWDWTICAQPLITGHILILIWYLSQDSDRVWPVGSRSSALLSAPRLRHATCSSLQQRRSWCARADGLSATITCHVCHLSSTASSHRFFIRGCFTLNLAVKMSYNGRPVFLTLQGYFIV